MACLDFDLFCFRFDCFVVCWFKSGLCLLLRFVSCVIVLVVCCLALVSWLFFVGSYIGLLAFVYDCLLRCFGLLVWFLCLILWCLRSGFGVTFCFGLILLLITLWCYCLVDCLLLLVRCLCLFVIYVVLVTRFWFCFVLVWLVWLFGICLFIFWVYVWF